MISFHFTYTFQSFTAQAIINEYKGKIACRILGVLSDESNQAVSFNDLELVYPGKDKNELTKAIERGFSKYLDNFPVDHCTYAHFNIENRSVETIN